MMHITTTIIAKFVIRISQLLLLTISTSLN